MVLTLIGILGIITWKKSFQIESISGSKCKWIFKYNKDIIYQNNVKVIDKKIDKFICSPFGNKRKEWRKHGLNQMNKLTSICSSTKNSVEVFCGKFTKCTSCKIQFKIILFHYCSGFIIKLRKWLSTSKIYLTTTAISLIRRGLLYAIKEQLVNPSMSTKYLLMHINLTVLDCSCLNKDIKKALYHKKMVTVMRKLCFTKLSKYSIIKIDDVTKFISSETNFWNVLENMMMR